MFKRVLKNLLLPVLMCVACVAMSQTTAILEGRVLDNQGRPLSYAAVTIANVTPIQGTMTDDRGHFSMTVAADSALVVRVRMSGFAVVDSNVVLRAGEKRDVLFILQVQSKELETVKIRDEKSRSTSFTNISVERLERVTGPQGGVETLIKMLPDVSSNNELSSQYSVRGGSFDENLVYINHVEIYRPQLIRSGQQEGSSIINPDMVSNILFSPGGFEAVFGDRMSSVLDITYAPPQTFRARLSASLLGATAFVEGTAGTRMTYKVGLRHNSNRYLFRSLETRGNYKTQYTDIQALLSYKLNEKLNVDFLGLASRNAYALQPQTQRTLFGGLNEQMEFLVYYEGQEIDRYGTLLGALTMDYHPNDDFSLRWTTSVQSTSEAEVYDILSEYFLYELNVGSVNADGETDKFDRGIGSYLEHARNYLYTDIFSTEIKSSHYAALGNWQWGLRLQHENIDDRMREWRWVDSAGYALPNLRETPLDTGMPVSPMLQQFCRSSNALSNNRIMGYVQRNVDFYTNHGDMLSFVLGARMQWYNLNFDDKVGNVVSNYQRPASFDDSSSSNNGWLFSPRMSFNVKPEWRRDMLFRLSAGVYSQAPYYREFRFDDGSVNRAIKAQHSYQVVGSFDWNMRIADSPFKLTADIYYKYLTNLIPYRVDNLRIRYDAHNDAVGYATGLSLRFSGEVVKGLESWASLSIMKTQEDIIGDDYGWLVRPTDQRISFKLFFQDYVPRIPFWRMSLNVVVGSGFPFTYPNQKDRSVAHYYPAYVRVDWGNTIQLSHIDALKKSPLFKYVDDILVTVDVFNLFDYRNAISYLWVADFENRYYAVPNFLTSRQLNLKLTVNF